MRVAAGLFLLRSHVSRILFPRRLAPSRGRSFLWDARRRAPRATYPRSGRPFRVGGRPGPGLLRLFGLSAGGVCRAVDVTANAVRSYRTISPLPEAVASGELPVASECDCWQLTTGHWQLLRAVSFCCTFRRLGPSVSRGVGPPWRYQAPCPISSDFPHPPRGGRDRLSGRSI